MPISNWGDLAWEEVASRKSPFAILPVGATEAHGPHLPLSTDVLIALAMARAAGERLEGPGLLLPPLSYSPAGYASGFPGTISLRPETATALLVDIARALSTQGVRLLGIANAHLDPDHLASIHRAVEIVRAEGLLRVAFPDLTRKPWAPRLTDEFKSGACHAGRFEGSVLLAERPDLVKDSIRRSLPPNPVSLSRAIQDGKRTFEEAGGPRAYFGDPAAATSEEGRRTIAVLGEILAEAMREA